ncbi:MAG: nuclear transport factor 2 family protein [Boseongicola sp.]|nr:nuclear transport factor 2 family protein [Boseongicola sp.]
MRAEQQIELVEAYFSAVDGEDLPRVLGMLTKDCVFTVETHGVELRGHEEIADMFRRLWTGHRAVLHEDFIHVPDPESGRIASRFKVVNTELDGRLAYKSNCNFFEIDGELFDRVAVYMAGKNTLDRYDRRT